MPVIKSPARRQRKSVTTKDGRVITRDTQIHTYSAPGKYWVADGIQFFRVFGEPMQEAKKDVAMIKMGGKMRLVPVDKDYRVVSDPDNPDKPFKYDIGFMHRWKVHVTMTVIELMRIHGVPRFSKNHPIAMGLLFYRTKPKSNDLWLPAVTPDEDNYAYAVKNALKMTPGRMLGDTRIPGPYPDGVLYFDDNQICWHTPWDGKVWADESEPPGVLISVQDCRDIKNQIWEKAYPNRLTLTLPL